MPPLRTTSPSLVVASALAAGAVALAACTPSASSSVSSSPAMSGTTISGDVSLAGSPASRPEHPGTVDWAAAGALAASQVEPDDDIHATATYRRHLVSVLTRQAGELALSRAREVNGAHH